MIDVFFDEGREERILRSLFDYFEYDLYSLAYCPALVVLPLHACFIHPVIIPVFVQPNLCSSFLVKSYECLAGQNNLEVLLNE